MSDDTHYHEKNYVNISNARIDAGFDILDVAMKKICNEHFLTYYEILIILSMMEAKIKNHETSQYFLDNITKFTDKINEDAEEGK